MLLSMNPVINCNILIQCFDIHGLYIYSCMCFCTVFTITVYMYSVICIHYIVSSFRTVELFMLIAIVNCIYAKECYPKQ